MTKITKLPDDPRLSPKASRERALRSSGGLRGRNKNHTGLENNGAVHTKRGAK